TRAQSGLCTALRRFVFFFSSRRRHTRFSRDWSSDVCSSDLDNKKPADAGGCKRVPKLDFEFAAVLVLNPFRCFATTSPGFTRRRSEERRVGKECRFRRAPSHVVNEV